MAAKSTENNAVETEAAAEDVKVPHQAEKPHLEVVEGTVVDDRPISEKIKGALTSKKLVAGVSSVVLIAAGVFVVKKRNENNVSEDEVTSD